MRLSQSEIKDALYPYGGGIACPYRWYKKKEGIRGEPSPAMLDGLIFEHELLGATAKDEEVPTMGEKKGGGLYKAEQDTRDLAVWTRNVVFNHYDIEITDVQVKMKTRDKKGTADALIKIEGRKAILDVKFTNYKNDEFNTWNFDRDNMTAAQSKQFKDAVRQSSHYVIMHHDLHGEWIPFYFLIVGKSGWVKLLRFALTRDGITKHEAEIQEVRELIGLWESEGWQKMPDYKTCVKCPVLDCDARLDFPMIKKYTV